MTAPQSVAARPNQRAPVVLPFLSCVLPPHSGDENDRCRSRHDPGRHESDRSPGRKRTTPSTRWL